MVAILLRVSPSHLRTAAIVHGDITPENVLVFNDHSRVIAKVADFGYSTCFHNRDDWLRCRSQSPGMLRNTTAVTSHLKRLGNGHLLVGLAVLLAHL